MLKIQKRPVGNAALRHTFLALACATAAASASAGEVEIRKSIESLYPTAKVTAVVATPMKGIYEATVGQDVVYADENGKFLMFGQLVDATTKKNLTEVTKERLTRIDFKDLPLELAVKTVKGDGSRVFASFEDPNCGYCKRFHDSLRRVDNYTLYTFLTPILSEDSKSKSRAIWCSNDKGPALTAWMQTGQLPSSTPCEAPIGKVLELSQRLGVKGTPTIFFEDGRRAPGYVPEAQLETMLNQAKTSKLASAK